MVWADGKTLTRKLGRTLFAAWVVCDAGCSHDQHAAPSDAEDGGSSASPRAPDSGAVARTADHDAGAGQTPRDVVRDAGIASEGPDPDGGAVAAGVARDASQATDARGDSSVNGSARASAGCGKSGRPSAGRVSVEGEHNYTFPEDYDGKVPFPLLLGFHAASNPIEELENLTRGSAFEQTHVRAFPKSKGSAWDYGTDMGRVLAMYDELLASYCIDTTRVFATGHSSGAQLIVQVLTDAHKADADHLRLTAVAPVAASHYGKLGRAVPVMYIQGKHDMVRNSDGSDVVQDFATANGCAATSMPYASAPSCMSSGKTVNDGCIQYDGCEAATVWCSHDDPQYGNTSHGWPCFATKAMYDFFAALP